MGDLRASTAAADLAVVCKLRALADSAQHRGLLLRDDTCVGGLVLLLDNPAAAVVLAALDTLSLLASAAGGRKALRDTIGLRAALTQLVTGSAHRENADAAKRLLSLLNRSPLRESVGFASAQPRAKSSRADAAGTKTLVLQMHGVRRPADVDLVRDRLVRVRGVISITFDLTRRRCILRCQRELEPRALATVLATATPDEAAGLRVDLVAKTEAGAELLVELRPLAAAADKAGVETGHEGGSAATAAGAALPEYLPDDSELFPSSADASAPQLQNCAGAGEDGDGFWSKAASFLQSSFFW